MLIRPETPADHAAIREVLVEAFPTGAEADLVERLRGQGACTISLVADSGSVVGHILFSPVSVEASAGRRFLGLAPMAVSPAHQRTGIGSRLVQAGIDACREIGAGGLVVLGHPGYYPRFGFRPASRFGLRSEYEVPDEVFMALELRAGAFSTGGLVRYHRCFAEMGS